MSRFTVPRNLEQSFGPAFKLVRLAGIFPVVYNKTYQSFQVSCKLMAITIMHIFLYSYVNITSIMENWRDYSQPMLGHSSLMALGNLVIRLLGILITFVIIIPYLYGSSEFAGSLNSYMLILEKLSQLGIDVTFFYRRIYYMSCSVSIGFIVIMSITAWHSIYFYEEITQREPEFKYYLVVILSFFYKALFLFSTGMQLFAVYLISGELNKYLIVLKRHYQELYESENDCMVDDIKELYESF